MDRPRISHPKDEPESEALGRIESIAKKGARILLYAAGLGAAAGIGYLSGDKVGATRSAIGYVTGHPTEEVRAANEALMRVEARLREARGRTNAAPFAAPAP